MHTRFNCGHANVSKYGISTKIHANDCPTSAFPLCAFMSHHRRPFLKSWVAEMVFFIRKDAVHLFFL